MSTKRNLASPVLDAVLTDLLLIEQECERPVSVRGSLIESSMVLLSRSDKKRLGVLVRVIRLALQQKYKGSAV